MVIDFAKKRVTSAKDMIMKKMIPAIIAVAICMWCSILNAQIGKRFPSEKKVIKDPVTGTMLTFLTSTPAGDSKIYQTH